MERFCTHVAKLVVNVLVVGKRGAAKAVCLLNIFIMMNEQWRGLRKVCERELEISIEDLGGVQNYQGVLSTNDAGDNRCSLEK